MSQSGGKVASSDDFYYSKRANTATWTPGQMWPYYQNSTSPILVAPVDQNDVSLSYFWWGTTFGHSKVKINKIGLDLVHAGSKAKGTVTEFEVWVTQNHDNMIGTKINIDPTTKTEVVNGGWTKVATINCNLTTDNTDTLFEIPEAVEASAIFVKVTGFTGVPMLRGISMYSVANYELTSSLENAALTGTVAPGNTLTFSIDSENNNLPNAKVYFALYSDGIIETVTVKPLALSAVDNRTYSVNYTIPNDATGTLSVRAFYLDGSTLVPLINAPVSVSAQ